MSITITAFPKANIQNFRKLINRFFHS